MPATPTADSLIRGLVRGCGHALRQAGQSRNLTTTLLIVALAVSNGVILFGAVRYRVPGRFWSRWAAGAGTTRIERPAFPLQRAYEPPLAPPKLGFDPDGGVYFGEWQARSRLKLAELLRVAIDNRAPVVRVVDTVRIGDLTRESLVLRHDDGLEVPAFLFLPPSARPRPAVLMIAGHGVGIVATAGIVDEYHDQGALRLAQAGYVVLAQEVRGMGYLERLGEGRMRMDLASHTNWSHVYGRTAMGRTVADAAAALGYLRGRTEIDGERLGVVGFSSGGKAAIYLSAVDPRVRVLVASGCVSSHDANFRYCRHSNYEVVPDLATWLEMSDLLGLFAPRPLLVHWGEYDQNHRTRDIFNNSSLPIFESARRIYDVAGERDSIEMSVTQGADHRFDSAAAIEFLHRRLPLDEPAL